MRVDLIVGARPNFVKAAPLYRALRAHPDDFDVHLVHTGQHYDVQMSDVFFADLQLPTPDVHLNVGSGSQGAQTGEIMSRYESVFLADPPQLVLVVGDVNSTMAGALVAVKQGAIVGHVEAGLRSGDRSMPEEINRLVTDAISDLLFTPSPDGCENLRREGKRDDQIILVGNVMIDSLMAAASAIESSTIRATLGIEAQRYGVLTLHRPSNVDDVHALRALLDAITSLGNDLQFVFPVHPRTRKALAQLGWANGHGRVGNVLVIDPLGYRDFLKLVKDSLVVVTDSGGLQEESTVLGIPCLTVRETTERPITISEGTSLLVGRDTDKLVVELRAILAGKGKRGRVPALWDGHAAVRIVDALRARRVGSAANVTARDRIAASVSGSSVG